jgi:hypothetical protein
MPTCTNTAVSAPKPAADPYGARRVKTATNKTSHGR